VENNDPENAISNIKILILRIEPQSDYAGPWILAENFALAAGDHKLIPLASYGEAQKENYTTPAYDRSDSDFQLLIPSKRTVIALAKSAPQVISLRATGVGTAPCDYSCKIWVDSSDAKLRIADEFRSSEYIPLIEAATRAHERLRHKPIAISTEVFADSADDILIAYCNLLAKPRNNTKNPLVTLHGTWPPSREVEEVDYSQFSNFDFVAESVSIILLEQRGRRKCVNLSISPDELTSAIDMLGRLEG
jgi:hypothetical protein